uniref:Uncharacterized protein n=1 Tax=Populus alba TaxID=43335 RepID=A0A4U5MXW6_POPAL|nr:hypothetical protein D5086_0000289980 [Populus alba]
MVENGSISRAGKGATLPQDKIVVEGSQFDDLENDGIVKDESIATDEKMTGDDSLEIKLKLETEESLRKLEIERILMVKPDIEVFLNSSLSTLSGEPDVLIMGALNDYLEVGNDPS